jgi:hypothetical protein
MPQGGEHTAYLLAVFGCMVNGLDHDNPRLHEVPIGGSKLSRQVVAGLVYCEGEQPFSADTGGLRQIGECPRGVKP